MRRILAHLAIGSAVALASLPVSAQSAPVGVAQPSIAQSLTGAAKDDYASALILSNNHDFAGALTKYQQAYDLSKDPRLLFNMAVCERNLRAYARMQSLLRQYKREVGSSITAQDRADVDGALAAIQNLVGAVTLAVNEQGASVVVDGQSVGATPLAAPVVLDLGEHTIVVKKPGFDDATQTVTVLGGSESALSITLVAHQHVAQLVVSAEEGAAVIIDGRFAGNGRFEGQLAPGAHRLRVTESGKIPYEAEVELRDGETRTADVTLDSEKHGSAIWPWVVGGVVVVAGAVVGGYFLFRPQPSAPPTAPDQLGSLQLSAWGR